MLAFDAAAAEAYGYIIAALGWVRGRDFDRMIAAHEIAEMAKGQSERQGQPDDDPDACRIGHGEPGSRRPDGLDRAGQARFALGRPVPY
ncbi:MAG TPA: hypothetical protein VHZ29_10080 [Rhizomicrobium sp.]|nr:hypothetical protein [Rhizomicrobium sp.]